jgi:HEAT repeat protein
MGKDAVPSLVESLDENEVVQAQQILELLGNIGDDRVMPKLAELMHSENAWIRCAAVYAIGRVGGRNAIPILIGALHDKNYRVCEISIETLASFDDLRVVPPLIELIQSLQPELAEKRPRPWPVDPGSPYYGSDWMSWQLCYDTDSRRSLP